MNNDIVGLCNRKKIVLASNDACTGCASCASVCPKQAITMRINNEGFLQPEINNRLCVKCHVCEKTCPLVTPKDNNDIDHTHVYAAKNKDEAIRKKSSSGGMFHALAKWTIEQGGVVFGAAFDGIHLKHQYVETLEEVCKFMGSKYVQSDVQDSYKDVKQFLDAGRWVLYSGTPCQIAGLKRFLRRDDEKLITVDLICYGVPSPAIFEKNMRRKLSKLRAKDIKDISFRNNVNYFFAFNYLDYDNEWHYCREECSENLYYSYFMRLIFRASCYQCQYRSIDASYADFTIGDCWEVVDIHPNLADGVGVSLIEIHTEKGQVIFDNTKINLEYEEEEVNIMQKRYAVAKQLELYNKSTRAWRLSNVLAQYILLEYIKWIYMHDKNDILKTQLRKIIKKIVCICQ